MEAFQLPMFKPVSNWTVPSEFPDLSYAQVIGVDVETHDPELAKNGPGSISKRGRIVGVSLATERESFYLPVAHEAGGNLNPKTVLRYVRQQLSNPHQVKVGANILYDLEWLHCDWGVSVAGPVRDVLVNEHLIDENEKLRNLERVSKKYTGVGKDESMLELACAEYFGKKAKTKENLWRLPPEYVGPYAEGDTKNLFAILRAQERIIRDEGLEQSYDIENRLIPMLLEMRLRGVPVDLDQAERIQQQLSQKERDLKVELYREAGRNEINVWSAEDLGRAFDAAGEYYPRTEKTNKPSFTQPWLEAHHSKIAKLVVETRKTNRLKDAFIGNVVLESNIKGRIHCQFNQAATVTGRFSSSNPNLQQIPARTEQGKLVRSCFVPEEGCDWDCCDYSQIEPRLQVHYAYTRGCRGATDARDRYVNDPSTDFHNMTAGLTGLSRRPAKTIHLGLSYGMGMDSLAYNLAVDLNEAKRLFGQYIGYMPWLPDVSRQAASYAQRHGYITTLLGRRARFPFWEAADYENRDPPVRDEELAKERWKQIRRAFTHKAFNKLIQMSAATVMKKAMVDYYQSGLARELGVPHLTVHDELDFSVPKDRGHLRREVERIMVNTVQLEVPLKVDIETGPNWRDVK